MVIDICFDCVRVTFIFKYTEKSFIHWHAIILTEDIKADPISIWQNGDGGMAI